MAEFSREKETPKITKEVLAALYHSNELRKLNVSKSELQSLQFHIQKSAKELSKNAAEELLSYLNKLGPILFKLHAGEGVSHFNMRHVGLNGENTGKRLVMMEGYLKTLISNAGIIYTQKNALELYQQLLETGNQDASAKRIQIEKQYYENIIDNFLRPQNLKLPCLVSNQIVMSEGILVRLRSCYDSDTFGLEGLRYNEKQGNFTWEMSGTYTRTHHGKMSVNEILRRNPIISPDFYKVYKKGVDFINENFELGKEDSTHILNI